MRSWAKGAALASLAVPLGAASAFSQAVAVEAGFCASARKAPPIDRDDLWRAVETAERCLSLTDLTDEQRLTVLRDAARQRTLVGDVFGAARHLERELELAPSRDDAALALARLLRPDRPREALKRAEQAAAAAPTDRLRARAHALAGEIKLDLGDAAGARASIERAAALSAGDIEVLLSAVHVLRERPAEAAPYALRLETEASAAPDWCRPAAYRLAARGWLELREYPRAIASARRALELDPDDRDAMRLALRAAQDQFKAALDPASRPAAPAGAEQPSAPAAGPETAPEPDELEPLRERFRRALAAGDRKAAEESADRFTIAAVDAADWQRLPAYRTAARMYLELGDRRKAGRIASYASALDVSSLETALLVYRIEQPKPGRQAIEDLAKAHASSAKEQRALKNYERMKLNIRRALELWPGIEPWLREERLED